MDEIKNLQFGELLTYWTLKGILQKSQIKSLGIKKIPGTNLSKHQKEITIANNDIYAKIIYAKVLDGETVIRYEIEYADIINEFGISKLYIKDDALNAIQDF